MGGARGAAHTQRSMTVNEALLEFLRSVDVAEADAIRNHDFRQRTAMGIRTRFAAVDTALAEARAGGLLIALKLGRRRRSRQGRRSFSVPFAGFLGGQMAL